MYIDEHGWYKGGTSMYEGGTSMYIDVRGWYIMVHQWYIMVHRCTRVVHQWYISGRREDQGLGQADLLDCAILGKRSQ